jgi:hypothetical protein
MSIRSAALRAQTLRHFAVFDSKNCSESVALSCGNHSAMKVGSEPCASVRSVMPVADNTFVYVEFTVTVAEGVTPRLSVGLSSSDFELSSEVPNKVKCYSAELTYLCIYRLDFVWAPLDLALLVCCRWDRLQSLLAA